MEYAILPQVNVAEALDSLMRCLVRSESAAPPVRLRSSYGRAAADDVLCATGLEDLSERLDAFGVDPDIWEQEIGARNDEGLEAIEERLDIARLDMRSLSATLGDTAARRCEQGFEALKGAVRKVIRLSHDVKDTAAPLVSPEEKQFPRHERLIDYAYDLRVPSSLRHGLALLLRTIASTLVIARAEERGERLSPWLALGLANAWAEAPERLCAIVGNPDVLLTWLLGAVTDWPLDQKLLAALEAWKEEARRTDQSLYFPFDPGREAE